MQASSNREENRTVLSFMAHLSLTFLVFFFSVFFISFSFESIEHAGVYTTDNEIPKRREQREESRSYLAKSCKSRESQRRRFLIFLDESRDRCRRSTVGLYRSINEQMENQRNRKWPA